MIFDAVGMELLGVHVIGGQACEPVHVGVTAMMTGGGAKLFPDTCYNYPTLGDLDELATHDALIKKAADAGRLEPPPPAATAG
jgi:NAD(P) transhydrogenase